MFDIGFFELCVIGIIALLVIGPEKLPRVARTVGLWTGKARGAIKTVKYDIDEQIRMEELKASMQRTASTVEKEFSETVNKAEDSLQEDQQKVDKQVHMDELKATMQRTANRVENEFSEIVNKAEDSLQEAQQEVNEQVASLKKNTEDNNS